MTRSRRWRAAAVLAGALCLSSSFTAGSAQGRAHQERINTTGILHDTRSATYRSPFGAVPVGRPVTLSLRTAAGAATGVTLEATETDGAGKVLGGVNRTMRRVRSGKRYDLWQTALTPDVLGVVGYHFLLRKAGAQIWYSSTALQEGGPGQVYTTRPDTNFTITAYDPGFTAPPWIPDAVIYQIFPDRFFNGDTSNDTAVMDPSYGGEHPVIHRSWSELPQPGGLDFSGGDLQGVIDKLPYLSDLGVNTLYLNPIFKAPSNHKYDTSDYFNIDPHFGTQETFQRLLTAATARHMHVILDGVFNHTGSDSIYFNRYGHFPDVGAFQSKSSPYYQWYNFIAWPTSYASFPGADSLPQLNESDPVKDFIFRGADSVAQHWLAQGTAGWRLDAAQEKSHGWWRAFRTAVKQRFPDSVLIAEDTVGPVNAVPYLLGKEVDGVMNYRFREAVLRFFGRGRGAAVNFPSRVTGLYSSVMSILEDYPLSAVYSSMNLVDSHDTDRILYDLGGDKRELRQVAAFQMTWIGAPTVYYGDEAGLTGAADPDDRRTFPWGQEDRTLQAYYRRLIAVRAAHSALRRGAVEPLVLDNAHRIFGYIRSDSHDQVAVVLNDDPGTHTVLVTLPKSVQSAHFTDALTGERYTATGRKLKLTVPAKSTLILSAATG